MGSKEKKAKKRSHGEDEQKSPKKSKSEAPIEETVKSPKKSKSDEFGSPKLQFNKECATPLKIGVEQSVKKKKKQKTQEVSEAETLPNHSSSDANQVLINGWPQSDVKELVQRIADKTPPNVKSMHFRTANQKIKWNEVKFKNYSEKQCQEMWMYVDNMQRKFRSFEEILTDATLWLNNPTVSHNNHKKEIHPDRPKPPPTVFFYFQKKERKKMKAENPELSGTEMSKKLGEAYRNLSEEKKARLQKKCQKKKQKYDQLLQQFLATHPEEVEKEKEKRAQQKTSGAKAASSSKKQPNYHPTFEKPKKPVQLYVEYRKSKLGENASVDKGVLEEEWKTLKEKRKVKWIKKALEYESEYKKMVEEYNAEHSTEYILPASVTTKEDRKMLDRFSGVPVKPPGSAYSLFSTERLKNKEKMVDITKEWKNLSDKEREVYNNRVKELQDQYKVERAAYLEKCTPEERERYLEKENQQKKQKPKASKPAVPKGQKTLDNCIIKTAKPQQKSPPVNSKKEPPKKPPKTPFDLYKDLQMKKNPKLLMKQIEISYKQLPSKEKASLQDRAEKLQEEFCEEWKKYLESLTTEELREYCMKENLAESASFGEGPSSRSVNANHQLSDDDDDSEEEEPSAKSPNKKVTASVAGNKADSSEEESDDEEEEEDKDEQKTIAPQIVKKLAESSDSESDSSSSTGSDSDGS